MGATEALARYHSARSHFRPSEGPEEGVLRGGGWISVAAYCRSANRGGDDPSIRNYNLGFRVALSSASGIPGSP
jgi:formylglycine-generating enzyme required for sulfatase activity